MIASVLARLRPPGRYSVEVRDRAAQASWCERATFDVLGAAVVAALTQVAALDVYYHGHAAYLVRVYDTNGAVVWTRGT